MPTQASRSMILVWLDRLLEIRLDYDLISTVAARVSTFAFDTAFLASFWVLSFSTSFPHLHFLRSVDSRATYEPLLTSLYVFQDLS